MADETPEVDTDNLTSAVGALAPEPAPAGEIQTYKRMARDPHIAFLTALICGPIKGTSYHVESDSPEATQLVEEFLNRQWRRLVRDMLCAVQFGYQPFEKLWQVDGDLVTYRKLKRLDPEHASYLADENGDFGGFKFHDITVPADKAFWFAFNFSEDDPYGSSRYEHVRRLWHEKDKAIDIRKLWYQKYVFTGDTAYAPPGQTKLKNGQVKDNFEAAREALAARKTGGTAVMPAARDSNGNRIWEIAEPQGQKPSDAILAYVRELNAEMSRGMLVPERTGMQSTESGSLAEAEAHGDVFLDMLQDAIEDIEMMANLYVVRPLKLVNFGDRVENVAIRLEQLNDERKRMVKQIVTSVIQTGIVPESIKEVVELPDLFDIANIPVSEDATERWREFRDRPSAAPTPALFSMSQNTDDGDTLTMARITGPDQLENSMLDEADLYFHGLVKQARRRATQKKTSIHDDSTS